MTQQYTPVAWQDETTSQQGTLINAERLNQMQTAHHYADGFEEVDAVPTANPSVAYHKVVYCTADSTFYRWDGTAWTADIDDETKALLQQEIARATEAEGELAQDLADETTARETADTAMQADITAMQIGKLDKQTADSIRNITKVYAVTRTTQKMLTVGYGPEQIPQYNIEETLFAKMPTLWDPTADTVVNYGWATAQIGAEATARAEADTLLGDRITAETTAREGADTALGNRITAEETRATQAEQANAQAIANTYTKAETDTLLGAKADQATTYTKSETDTLLASKADSTALATKLDTLSTTGLHAYTHNGATQSEVAVIDGTTASTIPIRDANGRLQAADPASGATDKSLVTANWVSQTGDSAPNNLLHKIGDETVDGRKNYVFAPMIKHITRVANVSNKWWKCWTFEANGSSNLRMWFKIISGNITIYLYCTVSTNGTNVQLLAYGDSRYDESHFKISRSGTNLILWIRPLYATSRIFGDVINETNVNYVSYSYWQVSTDGTQYDEPTTAEYDAITNAVWDGQ